MQGWRVNQEDAHVAKVDFDGETGFFAVYDGHGGCEVAKSCGLHLHEKLLGTPEFKEKLYDQALAKSFLEMDVYLRTEQGRAELETFVKETQKDENESMDSEEKDRIGDFVKSLVGRDADELRAMIGAVGKEPGESSEGSNDGGDQDHKEDGEDGEDDDHADDKDQEDDQEEEAEGSASPSKSPDNDDSGDSPRFLRRSHSLPIPVDGQLNMGPGFDSGCTAIAALVYPSGTKRFVLVANAGDSRAVLCRDGKALDLSTDHSPNLPGEYARIIAAGGTVSPDGRIQGNLNVARAVGDFRFKQNPEIPQASQMITALPETKVMELVAEDEFAIIACDGIWNVKSSQEVVDFVREKLAQKPERLSDVCGALCDECLAKDTSGDGSGCDNMTVLLLVLNERHKRVVVSEDSHIAKRQKL